MEKIGEKLKKLVKFKDLAEKVCFSDSKDVQIGKTHTHTHETQEIIVLECAAEISPAGRNKDNYIHTWRKPWG